MSTTEGSGSRLPRSNSVNSQDAGNQDSEPDRSYDETVAERAAEQVEKFREEYPERAGQPISRTPGRTLRSEVVEETHEVEYVEGDAEYEQGFTTTRLARAEAKTWADVLYEFLVARQAYDDGLGGKFRDTDTDEAFTKDFRDCWTTEYGDEQAAMNMGAQRQLMGGEYPERAESARWGDTEDGIWSDDIATILLTRTGSSLQDGSRVPPADHFDAVSRTWSQGGVYDAVRNVCEYHLGLDSDQWGYVRGDDVHGAGAAKGDGGSGANAAYVHCHDGIYLDLDETPLREDLESDYEVREALHWLFYEAIEKHLEACDIAEREAHRPYEACEVMLDELESPAGYATGYLRLDEDEDMMDRSIEMQAFAAVEWATNRQRIARSQVFTDAAKADMCKQDRESNHGSRLTYDHSGHGDGELVCAECGSGVGIEAETLSEHRMPEASNEPAVAADGGQVKVGAAVGEVPEKARVRSAVEEYIETYGEPESVPGMLAELGVPPHQEVAEEVIDGVDSSGVEPVMGPPRSEPEYELEAIVQPDGEEEPASGGGGGANTIDLLLPAERLARETRLQHIGEAGHPTIVVEDGDKRLATYDPMTAARWLVKHGYRRPWHAELALSFDDYRGEGIPAVFEEPVAEPPGGVG